MDEKQAHSCENTVDVDSKKHEGDEEIQWKKVDTIETELNGIDAEFVPTKESLQKPRCFCFHPWICCCCVWMLGLSWKIKVPVIAVLVVFVVWAILSFDFNTCIYTAVKISPLPDPSKLLPNGKQPPTSALKQSHGFVLTLLGHFIHLTLP